MYMFVYIVFPSENKNKISARKNKKKQTMKISTIALQLCQYGYTDTTELHKHEQQQL